MRGGPTPDDVDGERVEVSGGGCAVPVPSCDYTFRACSELSGLSLRLALRPAAGDSGSGASASRVRDMTMTRVAGFYALGAHGVRARQAP